MPRNTAWKHGIDGINEADVIGLVFIDYRGCQDSEGPKLTEEP